MKKNQMLLGIILVVIGAIIVTFLPSNIPNEIRNGILGVTEILAICVGVIIVLYGWVNDDDKYKETEVNKK